MFPQRFRVAEAAFCRGRMRANSGELNICRTSGPVSPVVVWAGPPKRPRRASSQTKRGLGIDRMSLTAINANRKPGRQVLGPRAYGPNYGPRIWWYKSLVDGDDHQTVAPAEGIDVVRRMAFCPKPIGLVVGDLKCIVLVVLVIAAAPAVTRAQIALDGRSVLGAADKPPPPMPDRPELRGSVWSGTPEMLGATDLVPSSSNLLPGAADLFPNAADWARNYNNNSTQPTQQCALDPNGIGGVFKRCY